MNQARWPGWEAHIASLTEEEVRREFLVMCLRSETPDMMRALEDKLRIAVEGLREIEAQAGMSVAIGGPPSLIAERTLREMGEA